MMSTYVTPNDDPNRIDAGELWDGEGHVIDGGVNHGVTL